MHEKIKNLTNKTNERNQASCIMDKDGKFLFEQECISKSWVEYTLNLYNDYRDCMPPFPITSEESILKEKARKAIK